MAMLTVRNLPDGVHRALRIQAARYERSAEEKVREILTLAVKPEGSLRIGDALGALGRNNGLSNADVEVHSAVREQTPATLLSFK